jgi:hypothetical protein
MPSHADFMYGMAPKVLVEEVLGDVCCCTKRESDGVAVHYWFDVEARAKRIVCVCWDRLGDIYFILGFGKFTLIELSLCSRGVKDANHRVPSGEGGKSC